MGWQRHQLDHMQIICTLLQTDNHTSSSSLNFLQSRCSTSLTVAKRLISAEFQVVSIRGNKRAYVAAKSALFLPITYMKLPAYELNPHAYRFCLDEWQDIWNCCERNQLHSIYPTVSIVTHNRNFLPWLKHVNWTGMMLWIIVDERCR